eukprot:Nk52_evm55s239 gene=Nk52_evmTU55s239
MAPSKGKGTAGGSTKKGFMSKAEAEKTYKCSIEQQLKYERKAYRLQEYLIDHDSVNEEKLTEIGNQILPVHYSDVVVERAAGRTCGFPLCSKSIEMEKYHGSYHVAISEKKVYQVSDLNNFCSKKCMGESQFFAAQLSEVALWLRTQIDHVQFEYLNRNMTGEGKEEKSAPVKDEGESESEGIVVREKNVEEVEGEGGEDKTVRFSSVVKTKILDYATEVNEALKKELCKTTDVTEATVPLKGKVTKTVMETEADIEYEELVEGEEEDINAESDEEGDSCSDEELEAGRDGMNEYDSMASLFSKEETIPIGEVKLSKFGSIWTRLSNFCCSDTLEYLRNCSLNSVGSIAEGVDRLSLSSKGKEPAAEIEEDLELEEQSDGEEQTERIRYNPYAVHGNALLKRQKVLLSQLKNVLPSVCEQLNISWTSVYEDIKALSDTFDYNRKDLVVPSINELKIISMVLIKLLINVNQTSPWTRTSGLSSRIVSLLISETNTTKDELDAFVNVFDFEMPIY